MRYIIETIQEFGVTYRVEADSPEEAWAKLINEEGDVECLDQSPGNMIGTLEVASIEVDE